MDYPHFFINGAWREPESDKRIAVESPATCEMVGSCPEAVEADVNAAVSAASAALSCDDWAGTSGAVRADYIDALSDAMKSSHGPCDLCRSGDWSAHQLFKGPGGDGADDTQVLCSVGQRFCV